MLVIQPAYKVNLKLHSLNIANRGGLLVKALALNTRKLLDAPTVDYDCDHFSTVINKFDLRCAPSGLFLYYFIVNLLCISTVLNKNLK